MDEKFLLLSRRKARKKRGQLPVSAATKKSGSGGGGDGECWFKIIQKRSRVDVPWQVLKVAGFYFHVSLNRENCMFRHKFSEELGLVLLTYMCSRKKEMNKSQMSD